MKKRIMVFCDFYLPSFKSGGGMWTVANLVDRFFEQYDFFIVTRNYDSKGDKKPYDSVKTDAWNDVDNAKVYYIADGNWTTKKAADLINEIKPDAFFLNSAFALPVLRMLTARRRGLIDDVPVVLAPCGELARGALSVKPLKKKVFLKYAAVAGLYKNVIWKASFETEADEIREVIGKDVEIMTAPDLVPRKILPGYSQDGKLQKKKGEVRFVFVSRLVRKKNIAFFLERLREIGGGEITFEIVGPLEDQAYWNECRAIITELPQNVKIEVTGPVSYTEALERKYRNHFFAMPTLNENFGYVFLEALAAGTPLLISDRTIWDDIDEKGVGWSIPLEDPQKFVERIRYCVEMDTDEYAAMSARARQYAVEWLAKPEVNEATARVLARALTGNAITATEQISCDA